MSNASPRRSRYSSSKLKINERIKPLASSFSTTDIDGRQIKLEHIIGCSFTQFTISNKNLVSIKAIVLGFVYLLLVTAVLISQQEFIKTWMLLLVGCIGAYLYLNYLCVIEENAVFIQGFGIQVATSYYTGRKLETFVSVDTIADVVINEVITLQRAIYMIYIMTKDPAKSLSNDKSNVSYSSVNGAIPFFKETKPRLETLVKIYNEAQRILRSTDYSSENKLC